MIASVQSCLKLHSFVTCVPNHCAFEQLYLAFSQSGHQLPRLLCGLLHLLCLLPSPLNLLLQQTFEIGLCLSSSTAIQELLDIERQETEVRPLVRRGREPLLFASVIATCCSILWQRFRRREVVSVGKERLDEVVGRRELQQSEQLEIGGEERSQ